MATDAEPTQPSGETPPEEAIDHTPEGIISGLIWRPSNGSIPVHGRAQHTGTAGHAETVQRLTNLLTRTGVADEVWLDQGINRSFGAGPGGVQSMGISNRRPDLVYRQGRSFYSIEVASGTQLRGGGAARLERSMQDTHRAAEALGTRHRSVLVNASSLPQNASGRTLSALESFTEVMHMARRPLAALEIGCHLYQVVRSEDRVEAVAHAAGSMIGARAGASAGAVAGAAVGAFGGPVGAAVGSLTGAIAGGLAGSVAGNYFADRLLGVLGAGGGGRGSGGASNGGPPLAGSGQLGGVDLSGSLHLIDHIPSTVGILVDATLGKAMAASKVAVDATATLFPDLTAQDLAVILKVEYFNHGQGSFSLDPADPMNPFGPFQKKVFHPPFLAGTDVGELLFRADVLLKRISLGLETPQLPGWVGPFELGSSGQSTHRLWIVCSEMVVECAHHPDHPTGKCLRSPSVKLAVRACAQVADPDAPTGLRDSPVTDPRDPACLMAAQCTNRMAELIDYYPTLKMLDRVYGAVAVCRAMRKFGATVDYAWVELYGTPLFDTPMKVETLRNARSTSSQAGNVVTTSTQTLVGGCILATTDAKLQVNEVMDTGTELAHFLGSMQGPRAGAPPPCYLAGRRLGESVDEGEQLRAALESAGGSPLNIELPFPEPQTSNVVVQMPFVQQVSLRCAICQRALAGELGDEGDQTRFQSVRGVPLCSRVHRSVMGPFFRLTRFKPCALCTEELQGSIITIRSTAAEDAKDYHECCAPPESVAQLQAEKEDLDRELDALQSLLLGHEAGGERLGGNGDSSRLMHLSTGSELTDMQLAMQASLSGMPTSPPLEDMQLQLAIAASQAENLQNNDDYNNREENARFATGPFAGMPATDEVPEDAGFQAALEESLQMQHGAPSFDAELQLAMSMSLQQEPTANGSGGMQGEDANELQMALEASLVGYGHEAEIHDEELQMALAMSLQETPGTGEADAAEQQRLRRERALAAALARSGR